MSIQEQFKQLIRQIEISNEESLNNAIQLIQQTPQIAEIFAQQSPKFREIFSHLQPGVTNNLISIKFYQLISEILSVLLPNYNVFLNSLNYLADTLIQGHLNFLIELMKTNRSKTSLQILTKTVLVNKVHCGNLFSSLAFSNLTFSDKDFRKFIQNDGITEYVKLATVFLLNDEVSQPFLSTQYSLWPIWKNLKKVDFMYVVPFIQALEKATKGLSQSTKCWLFNDKTLQALSDFPLIQSRQIDDIDIKAPEAMYAFLQSIMSGKNSIIVEDPKRTYCISPQDLDPHPRNSHILHFITSLKVWNKRADRDLSLFIFEQSPDLISRFLVEQKRGIPADLQSVHTMYYLGKIIDLDWPDFLYEDTDFLKEGRSLDYLFESILPSVLTNAEIEAFFDSQHILLRRMIIVLFLKAVIKFDKLPPFLKTHDIFMKFRGRIPNDLARKCLTNSFSEYEIILPDALKLLIILDKVFPFFISDSISKEPQFISNFAKYTQLSQLEIVKFIPHLQNPLPQIKNLSSILLNEKSLSSDIQKRILMAIIEIIEKSGVFDGFENEIPIFAGESLHTNNANALFELINLIKGNFKYIGDGSISPVCNYLLSQRQARMKSDNQKAPNPLLSCLNLISFMTDNERLRIPEIDLNLSPVVIMNNLKWFSIESSTILLCAAIENNISDLDLSLRCLTIVVMCDTNRTLKYVLNYPYIRSNIFRGSETLDSYISQFISFSKSCDEDLAESFIKGNVTKEVIERVAPSIPETYTRELIRKMIKNGLSIHDVVSEKDFQQLKKYEETVEQFTPFWKWAFKGFKPIDLSKISNNAIQSLSKSLRDIPFLLDLLRTIYINGCEPKLKSHIVYTYETLSEHQIDHPKFYERLLVFSIVLLPTFNGIKITNSLPVCFATESCIDDPVLVFEQTKKEWSLDYLLHQIRKSPFSQKSNIESIFSNGESLGNLKIQYIIDFYLQHQGESFLSTFDDLMLIYIVDHPEIIKSPPKFEFPLFDSIAREILNPERLIEYDESQFEGIANVLLGTNQSPSNRNKVRISVRVILYLATALPYSPSFYQLIEHAHISPNSFLFATGEVAKTIIQCIESHQTIFPHSLCRRTSYLSPFHVVRQDGSGFEVDTPFFRFLLQFAAYLLSSSAVPLENYIVSGAVSILFRALSSKDEHSRNVAYASLSDLYDLNMKKTDYSYHYQLQLLLESLINAVPTPGKRFPSLITYFLTLASSIITRPRKVLFSTVIQFFASDKTLRCGSVPLFNSLFGQSGLEYKAQRNWILKMLKNGVSEPDDIELMKKGKIFERLCAFFGSPLSETKSRTMILEILLNCSKYTKLDGIVIWVYSIMTERFAYNHIDQLIALAFSIRSKDAIEKDCVLAIARLSWSKYRNSLINSKEKVEHLIHQFGP